MNDLKNDALDHMLSEEAVCDSMMVEDEFPDLKSEPEIATEAFVAPAEDETTAFALRAAVDAAAERDAAERAASPAEIARLVAERERSLTAGRALDREKHHHVTSAAFVELTATMVSAAKASNAAGVAACSAAIDATTSIMKELAYLDERARG